MLMHAITHGCRKDTARESALEVDSGRKIPCRTGDSNRAITGPPSCRVYRGLCQLHAVCTEASASFMPCVQRSLVPLCRVYRSICHLYVVCTEVSAAFMSCIQKYLPPSCRVYSLTSWSTATVFQLHVCLCHLHVTVSCASVLSSC